MDSVIGVEKQERKSPSCNRHKYEGLLTMEEFKKRVFGSMHNKRTNEERNVEGSSTKPVNNPESEAIPVVLPILKYALPENRLFIDCLNRDFYMAVKCIREEDVISVAFEGQSGKQLKLCLLSISTLNDVFIFDICKLEEAAFEKGLTHILEDPHIEKIIHNSRRFVAVLQYHYCTKLVNVFDTLMSSEVIQKLNNGNNQVLDSVYDLHWCLEEYLHLNPDDLHQNNSENLNWRCRPLPSTLFDLAVENVIYLGLLKEKCKKMMLGEFNKAVNYFNKSIRSCSSKELEQKNIDPDCTPSCFFAERMYVKALHLSIPSEEILAESAMLKESLVVKKNVKANEVQTSTKSVTPKETLVKENIKAHEVQTSTKSVVPKETLVVKENIRANEVQTSKALQASVSSQVETASTTIKPLMSCKQQVGSIKAAIEDLRKKKPQIMKSSMPSGITNIVQNQKFLSTNTSAKTAPSKIDCINGMNQQLKKEKEPVKDKAENVFSWPVVSSEDSTHHLNFYPG